MATEWQTDNLTTCLFFHRLILRWVQHRRGAIRHVDWKDLDVYQYSSGHCADLWMRPCLLFWSLVLWRKILNTSCNWEKLMKKIVVFNTFNTPHWWTLCSLVCASAQGRPHRGYRATNIYWMFNKWVQIIMCIAFCSVFQLIISAVSHNTRVCEVIIYRWKRSTSWSRSQHYNMVVAQAVPSSAENFFQGSWFLSSVLVKHRAPLWNDHRTKAHNCLELSRAIHSMKLY